MVAWNLAVLLPGWAGQYPYYAPLGAVLAMYPTVASSFQQTLRSLLAIFLGALLAGAALIAPWPNSVLIAGVVVVGVLAGVWPLVGEQGSWIPMSALFILLIGGDRPLIYIAGFTVEIIVGLAVGVVINLVLFPPLHLGLSMRRLNHLRETLAAQLDDVAMLSRGHGEQTYEQWRADEPDLDRLLAEVRTAVGQADEARRGNPRARRHRAQLEAQYQELYPLERVTILLRDLDESLREEPDSVRQLRLLDETARDRIATALTQLADILRPANDADAAQSRLADAEQTYDALVECIQAEPRNLSYLSGTTTIAVDIRHALDALTPHEDDAPPLNNFPKQQH